jgi:hypothetical protein
VGGHKQNTPSENFSKKSPNLGRFGDQACLYESISKVLLYPVLKKDQNKYLKRGSNVFQMKF